MLDFLSDTDHFDLIYYDAFAPDKQTDIWTQDIFDYLYAHTSDKGVLVTYCSKGIVKRMLKQSGYDVEKIAGPKGKREMLRAIKSIFLDDC
ncbi:MAG: MnmC family methyltransferase [Dysgonomonas sp.]